MSTGVPCYKDLSVELQLRKLKTEESYRSTKPNSTTMPLAKTVQYLRGAILLSRP